ncbi:MAG: PQQ-binding-like beta-propeller repeat protein [Micrococcales bacterium]|nr:PQQ-binding-like beta-propeller repeat protein [Micrococcales bacterium]
MKLVRCGWLVCGMVGILLGVSACTDSEGLGTATDTRSPSVAFDPPSQFDLARAVTLTEDEALQGTLHGTVLFFVSDGAVHATDLAEKKPLWSTNLSEHTKQDYVRSPFVLGDAVVVASGERREDGTALSNYVVGIAGFDAFTGKVVWRLSIPIYSLPLEMYDGRKSDPSEYRPHAWFGLTIAERDEGLLVSLGNGAGPYTTLMLDPSTGDLRWQADVMMIGTASGRYGVAAPGDRNFVPGDAVALDLHTGEVVAQLSESSSARSRSFVDRYGDGSYIIFSIFDDSSTKRFLRFSSTDASVQPFDPADDDLRYMPEISCSLEPEQAVALCQDEISNSAYGIDPSSGRVVWALAEPRDEALTYATQFHGNVYGLLNKRGAVVSLDTGKVIESNLGVRPIGDIVNFSSMSIKINEYGAIGMLGETSATGKYVWVPTSR